MSSRRATVQPDGQTASQAASLSIFLEDKSQLSHVSVGYIMRRVKNSIKMEIVEIADQSELFLLNATIKGKMLLLRPS